MKHLFSLVVVLMTVGVLSAILVGCSEKNAPTEIDEETTGVYLIFYASSVLHNNCDIRFYYVDDSGNTVEIPSAVRTTPVDTTGEDLAFYRRFSVYSNPLYLPLSDFKAFKTTEPLEVTASKSRKLFVKATRNRTPLILDEDANLWVNGQIKWHYALFMTPVDDKYNVVQVSGYAGSSYIATKPDYLEENFDDMLTYITDNTTWEIKID